MNEIFFTISENLDGSYEARALGHSIFTDADNLESLYKNLKEAVSCHFEESEKPKVIRLHFVREEVIAA
jgi:hypothetical protein